MLLTKIRFAIITCILSFIFSQLTDDRFEIHNISETLLNGLKSCKRMSIKRSKCPISYYENSTATFNIILSGDIERNPGPGTHAPKCKECFKTVKSNQKRMICDKCLSVSHVKCLNKEHLNVKSRIPCTYTCHTCLHIELPFFNSTLPSNDIQDCLLQPMNETSLADHVESEINHHRLIFNDHSNLLKVMHLNTQSMVSTFDCFTSLLHDHPYDVLCLSETWLKDCKHLLNYVQIPEYKIHFRNRINGRGGGVGMYVRESIKHTKRNDIIDLDNELEHLWVEIKGRNNQSNILVGVIYQPKFLIHEQELWLEKVDSLLSKVSYMWQGQIILTGDMNIDLFKEQNISQQYLDMLQSYDLHQHITKPTRQKACIDHIWTNNPRKV